MSLPQGGALLGCVCDRLQGPRLVGQVSRRGAGGRGVLKQVNTVEFAHSSSTASSFTCDVEWYKLSRRSPSVGPAWFLGHRRSGGGCTGAAVVTTPAQRGAI